MGQHQESPAKALLLGYSEFQTYYITVKLKNEAVQ